MTTNAGKSCASCGGLYGTEVLFCPLDGTPLSSSRTLAAHPNEIDPYLFLELPGQIQLNALVGIGSMGRVYRAFQAGVERDVAVKILHRELTGNLELVARFHREAKIASRLVHPNVVQVLMTGSLPPSKDARIGGEVHLVMEYLDGISLLSALAAQGEGGALPLARTLHIILQLCEAVGEAHVNNIVHRDLKPENIMLVRRGEDPDFVKVLDFGIARLDSALEGSTTQAGLIFGTAKYISPEGAEGKHVGPQADVYAIATVLYQCLAGRTPFLGDSPMALLVQQIHGTPTDLRSVPRAAYVPEPIARLVMGNLSKDAQDRSENARVFGRELALAARESGLHLDTMHGGAPRGDLRLLSKQRTRQHEFSAELKAKIASIPNGANGAAAAIDAVVAGASPRPITTFEDAPAVPRPVPPAPPPPSSSGASARPRPTEIGDASARPGGTQVAFDAPGHTQLPDEPWDPGHLAQEVRDDEDMTINGTLDASSSTPAEDRPRPGPTIPGSPITGANGVAAITASTTPTEDFADQGGVEGPLSSRPGGRPSHPGLLNGAAAGSIAAKPGASRPGPSNPGLSAPALSGRASIPSNPGITPMPSRPPLAPPSGAPKGNPPPLPPAHADAAETNEEAPAPAKPAARLKPEPTLAEPLIKKPRGLSNEDRDDVAPTRPVTWRTFALIASLIVIVPVVALGAAKLLNSRTSETQGFDAMLAEAETAKERRAWDAPPGANVKELTDKLLAESPGDRRVLSLRAAAADAIVNDGIAKRLSGDNTEALRLFRLALELAPELESARGLVAQLEATQATSAQSQATASQPAQTPASSSATTAVSTAAPPDSGKPNLTGKLPTAKSGSTSTVAPKTSGKTNDPDDVIQVPDVPPPPPSTGSSGPWL
ncbi:MAG: protein kinase [Polyangiaceae bacterium]|nr:protein kinase [Polyangiaceae bacterium]